MAWQEYFLLDKTKMCKNTRKFAYFFSESFFQKKSCFGALTAGKTNAEA